MWRFRFSCLLFFVFAISYSSKAGCLISGSQIVYTQPDNSSLGALLSNLLGFPVYSNSVTAPAVSSCINLTQTKYQAGSTNCGVCLQGYSQVLGLACANNSLVQGKVATPAMVACPIDDYAWLLVVSSASMLFFKIRNRKD